MQTRNSSMAMETQKYHKRLSSDVENSTGSKNGFFKILEGNKISPILKAFEAEDCISSSGVKCNTPPTPLP
ncbi:hypothetical protein Tco_1360080 [Tanacetum coccineum]